MKLCKDCANFDSTLGYYCWRVSGVSMVTGQTEKTCAGPADAERKAPRWLAAVFNLCGPDARHFIAKEST